MMRVYKSVKFKDKILQDLAEKRMIFSKVLSKKVKLLKNNLCILQLNIRSYQLGENVKCICLLRTIRSPEGPVISNCGAPAKKPLNF